MMPVWKYRGIEDMPDVWKLHRDVPVGRRARAILSMAVLSGPLDLPRGVQKFRSFEDLAADRSRYEQERVSRIRAKRAQKP
jgi:hypothetical protein